MKKTTPLSVPLSSIKVLTGRGRKMFSRIGEMAESLREHGFIHPIAVTRNSDGSYELVAGERRYRAALIAGFKDIPVTVLEDLSPFERKACELEENIQRSEITWDEQCEMLDQLHSLKVQVDPNWSHSDTADLTHQSRGHVSQQIAIAKELRVNPELKAKVKKLDIRSAAKVIKREKDIRRAERLQAQGKLVVTQEYQLGDCRELIKLVPTNSVDLLLTDPPYGLERIEKLRKSGAGRPEARSFGLTSSSLNLDIKQVLSILQSLTPDLTRVLKPGAHVYFFCAFQHIGDFIQALSPLEFQPPVIIWDHERNTQTGLGYNYISRCEPIIMLHNPPRGRRLAKSMGNIISHPEVPRGISRFATEKPEGLLRILIEQSTIIGECVLDPFGGSGSTIKATRSSSRRGVSFEIDEPTFKRTLLNLEGKNEK